MDPGSGEDRGEEEQVSNELLAHVREVTELQRQLEGLEAVTATLQAAASRADRTAGSAAAAAAGRPGAGRARGIIGLGRHRRVAEEAAEAAEDEEEVHPHVTCDGCHAGPTLRGRVMHCTDCEDFDLCARCYHSRDRLGHPRGHRFAPRASPQRVQPERRGTPSQLLMQMLERAMFSEALRRSMEGDGGDETARAEARGVELMASLPRKAWSPSLASSADCSQGHECALCLEDYELNEQVVVLPCTHFFHEECVRPWFAKSNLCPLCQQEASSASEGRPAP